MSSAKKSIELQAQVRHNAGELMNTLSDLYSWQKEIKDKEKTLQEEPQNGSSGAFNMNNLDIKPIRSQVRQSESEQTDVQSAREDVKIVNEELNREEQRLANAKNKANEHKERGNMQVKLGQYTDAITEYTAAIDAFSEDPIFYSNRAFCYLKLENYDQCIENCNNAIAIDKQAVKAYYRRMQANESLGNHMDALRDCTTVLTIEPKNSEAKRSLERINSKLRENAKGVKGAHFTPLRDNFHDILPINKPAYKRSNKPLVKVPIVEVLGPKETKNQSNTTLQISDEEIDKIFNSNVGPYVEVKPKVEKPKKKYRSTRKVTVASSSDEYEIEKKDAVKINQIENNKISQEVSDDKKEIPQIEEIKMRESSGENSDENNVDTDQFVWNEQIEFMRPTPPPPSSSAQFYTDWKELKDSQKYLYFKAIPINEICKMLGAGFDSDTLTNVLKILDEFYIYFNEPKLGETLNEVSKHNQIPILSLFMSAADRNVLKKILHVIKKDEKATEIAGTIARNFSA